MQEARQINALGLSKIRAANQLEHNQWVEELTPERLKEKAQKKADLKAKLDAVVLIQNAEEIKKLTCKTLDEQLAVHHWMDPDVLRIGQVKVKVLKITALLEAVARYKTCMETQGSPEPTNNPDNNDEDLSAGLQSDDEEEDEKELYWLIVLSNSTTIILIVLYIVIQQYIFLTKLN